jgi:hypothetical protein
MEITDNELKMLHTLYPLINYNDDREEANLSIEIFWKWKNYLYEKYNIDNDKHYIDHDGSIQERKKKDEGFGI